MNNDQWFAKLVSIESPDATWRPLEGSIVLERAKGSLMWDVEGNQ